MKKSALILLLSMAALICHARVHIPDSVMHRDGLYVDNMKIYPDSAIFQGANLKLDLFNTLYYLGTTKSQIQTYEMAFNVRLKKTYYPTLELGYAQGNQAADSVLWNGQGGWVNVGLDINGLKNNSATLNALLVGIRIGTSFQKYDMMNVPVADPYWKEQTTKDFVNQWRADCWGEAVAGCQVNVYSGLIMGWYLRIKVLFTRKAGEGESLPYYMPGFGYRNMTQWGLNYYIGWKF